VPSIEDMALTREGKATTPVGKPRSADDYVLPGVTATAPAEQRLAKGAP
jgi:hypothetical protein